MTYNQWNCNYNREAWKNRGLDCSSASRMPGLVRVVEELMPDIIGGQEVNKEMQAFFQWNCIERGLSYTIIWGNMTPIIYRADKFELLDTEYFLYPEKMDGYDGECNDSRSKSCNLGVFRCKETGMVFIFATTHLWWKSDAMQEGSEEIRVLQLKMATALIERYQKKYGCPAILVGDMNAGYDSRSLQYLIREGGFVHAYHMAEDYRCEKSGYNGCNADAPGVWRDEPFEAAIDHILLKDMPAHAVNRFDRYCPDYYLLLSDHAPAYIDCNINGEMREAT